ncbi:MAG: phosphoglycerate mutase, partial [Candidatus Hydrogenedentes bacterium]|nr:phosphoglycerate mutase [Candidatus Hydrogenedentota bacterium]
PAMAPSSRLYNRRGAVVSAVALVNGLGRIAGCEVRGGPGMTGWIDTNSGGKVSAALDALDRCDLSYIHIEAPDETSHQGRADLKIQAIEDYDKHVVQVCLAYLDAHPDTRLLAAPDHFTLVSTKGHAAGPVPFAVCGAGIAASGSSAYTEQEAEKSGILIEEGYQLVAQFLSAPAMDFSRTAPSEA